MMQKTNRSQTIFYALLLLLSLIVGLWPTQLTASTAPQTGQEAFKILDMQSVEGSQDIMALFIGSANEPICQQYVGFISKKDFQKKSEQTTYTIQAYELQRIIAAEEVPDNFAPETIPKFYFYTSRNGDGITRWSWEKQQHPFINEDSKIIDFSYTARGSLLLYHSRQLLVFDPTQTCSLLLYPGARATNMLNKASRDSAPSKVFLINREKINFDMATHKEVSALLKDVPLSEDRGKRQTRPVVRPNTTIIDPYNTYLYLDPAKLIAGYIRITCANLFISEDIRRMLLHFLGKRREFQIIQMGEVENDPTHDILALCIKEKKVASPTYHITNIDEIYVGFISKKHYHAWQQESTMHKKDYQVEAYYLRISNRDRTTFTCVGGVTYLGGLWTTDQHVIDVSIQPNRALHDSQGFFLFDPSDPQKPLQKIQFTSTYLSSLSSQTTLNSQYSTQHYQLSAKSQQQLYRETFRIGQGFTLSNYDKAILTAISNPPQRSTQDLQMIYYSTVGLSDSYRALDHDSGDMLNSNDILALLLGKEQDKDSQKYLAFISKKDLINSDKAKYAIQAYMIGATGKANSWPFDEQRIKEWHFSHEGRNSEGYWKIGGAIFWTAHPTVRTEDTVTCCFLFDPTQQAPLIDTEKTISRPDITRCLLLDTSYIKTSIQLLAPDNEQSHSPHKRAAVHHLYHPSLLIGGLVIGLSSCAILYYYWPTRLLQRWIANAKAVKRS